MKRSFNQCQRQRESISLLAAGVLPGRERAEVESHMTDCAGCRNYHHQLKSLTAPLSDWEENFVHIEASQPFRNRLAKAIEAAGEPKPVHEPSPGISSSLVQKLLSFRWHLVGMSAVWLLALLLSSEPSSTPASQVAGQNAPSPRQVVAALRENRRQIADLLGSTDSLIQPAILPPKRSESVSSALMV